MKAITIIVLCIAILSAIVAAGYFGNNYLNAKLNDAANIGYQQGQIDLAAYMIMQSSTCQQVPLTLGEKSVNLVTVECVQAAIAAGLQQ